MFGDDIVKERVAKERESAKKDSELYIERYNSRLAMSSVKKQQEEKVVSQSLALLVTNQESVASNLQRRMDAMQAKQALQQQKKALNLQQFRLFEQ